MSETKFTKGPWEPGRNPAFSTILDGYEGKAIYPKGENHHIAWANVFNADGELTMETALANAALMAAAPEMFALLERVVALSDDNNIYPMIPLGRVIEDIVEDAKKVLKKARGEQR